MSLSGRGVLVTRPRELAVGLAERIERAGGRAIVFPTIEIADLPPPPALRELPTFDAVIFISPSAVESGMRGAAGAWPAGVRAFAVGAGTAAALARRGVTRVLVPACGSDSEALLALPELERVGGMRILIVRGEGGRGLLGEALAGRGAIVQHAVCYRRVRPRADPAPLLDAWAKGAVSAVTVSSSEGLRNLLAMAGAEGEQRVRDTPLFVPHERVAAEAARLGLRALVAGPGDDAMLERLVAYFS